MDESILSELMKYNTNSLYPWHMPGHKRRLQTIFPEIVENPFSIDMTEIEGLDEFHHPDGIIKAAFEKAAGIYGSDESFYLVNGSTCGILAAISSVCKQGDEIIVARNCHISVYHAIRLLQLRPIYIMPEWNENLQIMGGVKPEQVKKALQSNPQAKAVMIVSPTYEGIVSDVEKIAKIVHKYKKPLIVDEAHGAHFEYMVNVNEAISNTNYKELPLPAIRQSADIVIESLHKTLPAMTQCAILHLKSDFINSKRLREFLSIYQSTSPSYVFMATMEACIDKMDRERDGLFIIYKELLFSYRKKLSQLQHIHLIQYSDFKKYGAQSYDIGKLVFSVRNCGIKTEQGVEFFTGKMLERMLYDEYGQVIEMASDSYVILMTSIADTKEAFELLYEAMSLIDDKLIDLSEYVDINNGNSICYDSIPEYKMDIGKASEAEQCKINLKDAAGKISGDYIYIYPPGIPVVTPGEVLSESIISGILKSIENGLNVKGVDIPGYGKDIDYVKVSVLNHKKSGVKKKLFYRR